MGLSPYFSFHAGMPNSRVGQRGDASLGRGKREREREGGGPLLGAEKLSRGLPNRRTGSARWAINRAGGDAGAMSTGGGISVHLSRNLIKRETTARGGGGWEGEEKR